MIVAASVELLSRKLAQVTTVRHKRLGFAGVDRPANDAQYPLSIGGAPLRTTAAQG